MKRILSLLMTMLTTLSMAAQNSITVTDEQVDAELDRKIQYFVDHLGSQEKLEQYFNKTIVEIKDEVRRAAKDNLLQEQVRAKIMERVMVTPSEVKKFYHDLPQDSIPMVEEQYEIVQIVKRPPVSIDEKLQVKDRLYQIRKRILEGESSFSTMAVLYSEDPGSAKKGGELGLTGKGVWASEFESTAFNLRDGEISDVIETEFGFHIIQLIDKSGERINCRHILLKPKVNQVAIDSLTAKLDTLISDVKEGKYTFESAVPYVSDDKNTRNNNGLMSYINPETGERTSRIEMQQLPTDIARQVEKMQPGDISQPFRMINEKGQVVIAVIRLKNRIQSHKATMTEDYQVLHEHVLGVEREKFIHQWIVNKIKTIYTRVPEQYHDCHFKYEGWIK